ncbi:hypothetical protein PhCBS80983_g06262 [Powellomyces hirtus]|uniref:PUM-HD domain-containing protein n=1 Tax=Powellomyces hirtus TaxID=109895 RepID=A0A507DRS2_9FUNG|nr:hypothetical protein PhCBS80983_g06262 [Powellomyces hirtus]
MQPHDRTNGPKRSLIDGRASDSLYSGDHRPDNSFFIESLRDSSDKDGSKEPAPIRRPSSGSTVFRRARAETFSFFPSKLLPEESVAPSDNVPTAATTASAVPITRHRSGSLSLPRSSISGAFGPSLFATTWQPSSILSAMERSGHSDYASSTGGEDETTAVARTLDYLGLDDPMLENNRQLAGNAYQVMARNPPKGAPVSSGYGSRGRSYSVAVGETLSLNVQPPAATYRPRATSIAFLESTVDSDIQAIRRSLAHGELELRMESDSPDSDMVDTDLYNVLAQTSPKEYMGYAVERGLGDSPSRHAAEFPHPHQIPTRSLWIGNIDPTLSPSDLLTLFSPFGPIESLRILPDKECAFVNYIRVEDAIRARDDMQGGRVGNCIVRIGFGKAEAINDTQGMQPTKSLWVGNIPPTTDPGELEAMFAAYGAVESARVLTHKNCGFVNFIRLEDAMEARKNMNGKEIGGSVIKIGYAKVPPRGTEPVSQLTTNGTGYLMSGSPIRERPSSGSESNAYGAYPGGNTIYPGNRAGNDVMAGSVQSQFAMENMGSTSRYATPLATAYANDQALAMAMAGARPLTRKDSADNVDAQWHGPSVTENYAQVIPPVPDARPNRRVDQVRLRELRKRLESHVTAKDVEAFFNEVIDETVDLCTDYIGNVVIQKIIEKTSDQHRLRLIEKIAPHMAAIGIHKNGTWVVQKMIDYAKTTSQIQVTVNALKAYTPPLLLDQFGNYVVQCCLRLGSHRNQFVFDAMHAKCYEIGQGRFGARAMRACLESQYTTKRQQKFVAEAIVHNVIQLATNPNGAILVTWLLDTSSLPGRYQAMAPKLVVHLAALCTHKLASATILKLVNQRVELEARELIIKEIFYREDVNVPSTLQHILADQIHGVSVIQKILASACVSSEEKIRLADRVRNVLSRMAEVRDNQMGYKRLLDELMIIPSSLSLDTGAADQPARRGQGFGSGMQGNPNDEVVSPLVPQAPGGGFTFSPNAVNGAVPMGSQQPQIPGWYAPAQLPTPSNSPQPGMYPPGVHHYGGMYAGGPGGQYATNPAGMQGPPHAHPQYFGSYPPSPQHPAPFNGAPQHYQHTQPHHPQYLHQQQSSQAYPANQAKSRDSTGDRPDAGN